MTDLLRSLPQTPTAHTCMCPDRRASARNARNALCGALLALAAAAAQAGAYSFIGSTDSGPLTGELFSGSFSYADPAAGFDGPVALDSFALSFNGQSYALENAPTAYFAAGIFLGVDYLGSASADTALRPDVQLVAGFTDLSQAQFAYAGAAGAIGFGDIQYTAAVPLPAPVPEPGALGLALAAAGLALVAGRRRRADRG